MTPQDVAIAALNGKFRCDNGTIGLDPPALRHLTAIKTTGPGLFDFEKLTLGEIVECLADSGLLAQPAEETNLKPQAPQVSMEELKERIGSVVDDYTAGEDYGSGPTRYYLTVGTPDELTAHLAAVLFPGLDQLFKMVASWQQLWDSKEEWERAATAAWSEVDTLKWLHAEAVWQQDTLRADMRIRQGALNDVLGRDRSQDSPTDYYSAVEDVAQLVRERRQLTAQVEAQGLPLAVLRKGVPDLLGQVDAMARRIREQDEQLALAMDTLGAIWLYVNWRYVSKQLTTEQKELWADAVDAFGEPQDGKAERWWRDDFVEGSHA